MDRRIVSGFACLAVAACGPVHPAWSQDVAPLSNSASALGTMPATPPVGFTPLEPISDSINGGSSLHKPLTARSKAGTRLMVPGRPPVPSRIAPPGTKEDPATVASSLVDGADLVLPPSAATSVTIPAGRPAPYAGQLPGSPRLQAAPASLTSGGRPAPYAQDVPTRPRPQQTPNPRVPSVEPATEVAPPALEPVSPRAELPTEPPVVAAAESSPTVVDAPPTLDAMPTVSATIPTTTGTPPSPLAMPALTAAEPKAVDLNFARTSLQDATSVRSTVKAKTAPIASRRAAAVGDEVITMHELELAVNETIQKYGQGQKPDTPTLNRIASQVLDTMIEESLINHEAKRKIGKTTKSQTAYNEFMERKFREDELLPMIRKTASANEYELNNKLMAESGRSVSDLREAFRRRLTAKDFLWNEIKSKVSADVSEMRDYYNNHLANFERPAQVVWREVEVDIRKSPDRATARKKVDAALDRLRRGEDFETVARTASDGVTARQGGKWETTPGGYADPVVNNALEQLPIGQVSQVLEGPSAFRIVRVDSRRQAGPARFDEVQDEIRNAVFEKSFDKAKDAYIQQLRKSILVVTIFDNTASDPALSRRTDTAVQPTSAR